MEQTQTWLGVLVFCYVQDKGEGVQYSAWRLFSLTTCLLAHVVLFGDVRSRNCVGIEKILVGKHVGRD